MFAHRASEKGAITIDNDTVTVTSPEGTQVTTKLRDFLRLLAPHRIDTGDIVLPMGTRSFCTRGQYSVLIHETRPRVCNFKWIDEKSPVPFGPGAVYRTARIALPYVLVYAVLEPGRRKMYRLSDVNECFFSNEPLSSLDQKLCYPALLNCSRYDPPEGRPLAWICTQHLRRPERKKGASRNQLLHLELIALLKCLYETGFNYSSEHHETESWFTASQKADRRIASVAAWEQATLDDPLCALDISWLPANLTAGEIMERIFTNVGAADQPISSADDLARLLFNNQNGAEEKTAKRMRSILQLLSQQV
jgi:hypothetical protein